MVGKSFTLIATLIVLTVSAAVLMWNFMRDEDKTYKNTVYGYELNYPRSLDAKEYSDDNVVFGLITKDAVVARAEARVITAQGESGQSLEDAVADQLKNYCTADSPSESFSCADTISTEPFATENGNAGFVLMLKGKLKNISSGAEREIPKGPYYVVTLASSPTISTVLVVSPPLNQTAPDADSHLIKTIAVSTYLTK